MHPSSSSCSSSSPPPLQQQWIREQELLKEKLVTVDDFPWEIPTASDPAGPTSLRYVGGVDISVAKDCPDLACAALVVVDLVGDLDVVYEAYNAARLHVPYVPGFLAFREAPMLVSLLEEMKEKAPHLFPQLLMVDGNGILHPRGFGLACHLGVQSGLPTIGIGKNLHNVDGLNMPEVKQLLKDEAKHSQDFVELVGKSGNIWGVAMRPSSGCLKPIFISVGHRISLDSCLKVVRLCCKFRVPEPIRQADIRSRRWFMNH